MKVLSPPTHHIFEVSMKNNLMMMVETTLMLPKLINNCWSDTPGFQETTNLEINTQNEIFLFEVNINSIRNF